MGATQDNSDLLSFLARDVALLERLRSRQVDVATPRDVDLHFFAPSVDAANKLVDALRRILTGVVVEVGTIESATSQVSVTFTVRQSILHVTARSAVEERFRVCAKVGAVHDGWGTAL
jgi:regulator of ribonuclease activity B